MILLNHTFKFIYIEHMIKSYTPLAHGVILPFDPWLMTISSFDFLNPGLFSLGRNHFVCYIELKQAFRYYEYFVLNY